MTDPQEAIRQYLITHGSATSPELERYSWDFRRVISRLRRKGMAIETHKVDGKKYALYVLPRGQMRLI